MDRSGEGRRPCHLPDLRVEKFSLSPFVTQSLSLFPVPFSLSLYLCSMYVYVFLSVDGLESQKLMLHVFLNCSASSFLRQRLTEPGVHQSS